MAEIEPILRAIDFLESHLRSPATIGEASEAAGYSLFHFCRLFSQVVRQTPYEYLMRRRLSEAALELRASHRSVLDIAIEYQFISAAGFSRAFKRLFGLRPSQMRQSVCVDPRRLMPRLTGAYLEDLTLLPSHPTRVSPAEVELVGVMAPCGAAETQDPGLWDFLADQISEQLISGASLSRYRLILYPRGYDGQGCFSFVGVPLLVLRRVPEILVTRRIFQSPGLNFQLPAGDVSLEAAMTYLYHTWLPHAQIERLPNTVVLRAPWAFHVTPIAPAELFIPEMSGSEGSNATQIPV